MPTINFGTGNATRYYQFTGPVLPNSDWSVGFWVRTSSLAGTAYQYPVSVGTGLGATNTFFIIIGENGAGGDANGFFLRALGAAGTEFNDGQYPFSAATEDRFCVIQRRSSVIEFYSALKSSIVSAPYFSSATNIPNGLTSQTWTIGARGYDLAADRFLKNPFGQFFILTDSSLTAAEVSILASGKAITTVRSTRAVDLRFTENNALELDLSGNGRNATQVGTGYTTVGGFLSDIPYIGSDGVSLTSKYVTKEYMQTWYPDLLPQFKAPQLWVAGYNANGRLGDGTTINKSSPVTTAGSNSTWRSLAEGGNHTLMLKTDGTLWACGISNFGQLGDGTTISKTSPVTTAGGGTNWKQIVAGQLHSHGIKTDGTLWSWGQGSTGQLGDNSTGTAQSPITVSGGGTTWQQVSAAATSSGAVKTDGTLWTWGNNTNGQLGIGTTVSRSSAGTTAGGGTNWKTVACGGTFTTAIKNDGTLWSWGQNLYGALGDGTTLDKSSPGTTAGGGVTWGTISCGYYHVQSIKTDGTLWSWGRSQTGQVGDGTTLPKSSPGTTAGGGTNWKQVASGLQHSIALKTDGTLWAWGQNQLNQLGDGTTLDSSSPGTTFGSGTNWKSVGGGTNGYVTAGISEGEGW
ncbi:Regulator of chromosome condensation (RCC1) repeat [uncultured Caudovirales phage]|uniref:Regulator of chromosome condensation (RCC1) repeat n=1 Tax=uncultured Caudovirales phage TaxID=2100421 RepID=A0A6J5KT19_9CAUD|nr:Regulator of chromosome condensation (RCC1) repeat [uncultured Caudovirales phage]